LVAFIATQSAKGVEPTDLNSLPLVGELRTMISKADSHLIKVLPRYMVPTSYIPVNFLPVLISSKTDRKRLRQFGSTVNLRQLDQGKNGTTTQRLSDLEQSLQHAWGQTLKIDAKVFGRNDNFFALGGDSLMAMRLVSVCRSQNLDLTVASIFGHPTLSGMAKVVQICHSQAKVETPAFSMISQSVESACLEASQICGSDPSAIEDIYSCTPTQESLFTFSIKSTKAYVAQRIACIPPDITLDAWKKAWEEVFAASPILRTRLVQLQDPGLQQVVLKEGISWQYSTNLTRFLENDCNKKMDLGQSLARYTIVEDSNDGKCYMVWTVHHVLYDGWSEPLILKEVSNALQKQHNEARTRIKEFVKFVHDTNEVEMQEFWQRELKGAVGPQFPRLPSRDYLPIPDGMLEHQISLETISGSSFTMATLIRGAWALVASQYTGSNDVVFGETLTGRDIQLPGVEGIVGPIIATVPVRIHVNRKLSVESYLQTIQQHMSARTPYQHMGMQNIRKVSRDAQHACEAGTGLVIQPEQEHVGSELGFHQGDAAREALHFNPYPLMLACGIRKDGFRICASFDSSLIEEEQMTRILAQLEKTCVQLMIHLASKIEDVVCLPQAEMNQIWRWNQTAPLTFDKSSRRFRADASIKQGSSYPHATVPWVINPHNSSQLSPIECVGELWLEGASLLGETVESPAWLVAGSSDYAGRTGKAQPTGDMVQLQGDGSLLFVRRKENILKIQGHDVDIADLETQFSNHLPSTVYATAAALQSSPDGGNEQVREQQMVVFIEQQLAEEENVELMSVKHNITCHKPGEQRFETTICGRIPVSLAAALKKLNKYMQDSFPPYMVPFAYIVIGNSPGGLAQIDQSRLNQLASNIPRFILIQLSEGLNEAWTKTSGQTNLTASESILRSSWSKILGLGLEQIEVDDNFFRLGGDSVLAMKLVSNLRGQGYGLTVADIFQHMRLSDAAKVLRSNHLLKERTQSYQPFSMMSNFEIESFLSEIIRPRLDNPRWTIKDVYPVTDSQTLDIRATIRAPRNSIQYTMMYLDKSINREQLVRACERLVQAHDILRTIFIEHESKFFQAVMDELDISMIMERTDRDLEQYITDFCNADVESDIRLGSSFLKMMHVDGEDGQHCLVIGLSHALYDGISLPRLLRDLQALYNGENVPDFEPYSSYITGIHNNTARTKALSYWRNLLNGSSLSTLDIPSLQRRDKAIFHRKPVDISQKNEEITTANLLTAAWALMLARRLKTRDVAFGSITSGRNIDLAHVENIMGPCYQFTPIRVLFEPQWTGVDLLQFVQRQGAESAAHDFLGFEVISKECTQWSSESQFFDSIVHHQDFEDFNTMSFAGRTCRVEILNPHGDAAHPLKAVSFTQGGQAYVGVVASERHPLFVDEMLDDLASTVQELAVRQSGDMLVV